MKYSRNKPVIFGLYGEKEFLMPDFIHCETIEYRSEKNNWIIKTHQHVNLFQVFVIEAGRVDFLFGDDKYMINTPSIVTIPENTLHALEVSQNIRGMVLTISSSFLETLFKSSPELLIEFSTTRILKEVKKKSAFMLVKQTVHGLYNELHDELPEKALVLQTHLSLLFCAIYRISLSISDRTISRDNRSAGYFRNFQRNVKQCVAVKKDINEYARELGITPVHLNRVCKLTVGKSALQVVNEFLLLEAKKYLKHTDYGISEIAYRLNFDDPAYFSRFFSKHAGQSPKDFRYNNVIRH